MFDIFGQLGAKVDLISTAETNLSIAVHESVTDDMVRPACLRCIPLCAELGL